MDLSPEQRQVAEFGKGILLVLAGPGSGKTRALCGRFAYLLGQGNPWQDLLCLTFTRTAAKEMVDRLATETGISQSALSSRIMTYHAFGMRVLHSSGLLPADNQRAVVPGAKQKALICRVLGPGIDYADAKAFIVLAKRRFRTPVETLADAPDYRTKVLANIYADYQAALHRAKQIDYDDQIFEAWRWLDSNPDALARVRARTHHVMVDEFQDTTPAQQALSELLGKTAESFVAVGDPNQSIFGFAGAAPSVIQNFKQEFPNSKVLYLAGNHRSTKQIIHQFAVVAPDEGARVLNSKMLEAAQNAPSGPSVESSTFPTPDAEVEGILDEISRQKLDYTDCALLFRTNRQIRVAEDECAKRGIPYQTVAASFYARPEIKLTLAFLQMIGNPDAYIETDGHGREWAEAIIFRSGLSRLQPLIRTLRHQGAGLSVSEQLELICLQTRLPEWLKRNEEIDDGDNHRAENVLELIGVAQGFQDQSDFLKFCRERTINPPNAEGLTLSTIHRAKGREWDAVFVCGVTDGLLPHKDGDIAEERRLLYVALSRAKRYLHISCSGHPSEFWTLLVNAKSQEINIYEEGAIKC